MRRAWIVALTLCWTTAASAEDCAVLSGAVVHTPEGVMKGGTVVVEDDRIAAVGRRLDGLEVQLNAQSEAVGATYHGRSCAFHSLGGKVLTPGFIEVSTQLGVVEVGAEGGTRDDQGAGDPIRASLRVMDAYNPLSSLIPIQRAGGVTGAVVSPTGGMIAGQAGFAVLAGERQADAVKSWQVAMFGAVNGSARPEGLADLRELLSDTDLYRRSRGEWERNQLRSLVPGASALDLEALIPVRTQQIPLVIHADRASDIEALLRLRQELNLRLVITGAAEGWRVADQLAAARVPVVIDPLVYGAGSFRQLGGRADNAALLEAAGVPVILSSFSSHSARRLRQLAGNAVRGGMSHEGALRAITSTAAEAFGLSERGAIRVGAAADLVVWSADPFEMASRAEQVWIDGRPQSLRHRQAALLDAYRQLPGSPRPAPALPEAEAR